MTKKKQMLVSAILGLSMVVGGCSQGNTNDKSSPSTANSIAIPELTYFRSEEEGEMTVKWNAVKDATGYELVYSTDEHFKDKMSEKTKDTSITIDDLKKGETYYLKLRADKNKKHSGYSHVKELTIHEHKYTANVSKKATCTKDGETTYKCSCGDTYTKGIPSIGHDYELIKTVDATCNKNGYKEYRCKNCGDTYTEIFAANSETLPEYSGRVDF